MAISDFKWRFEQCQNPNKGWITSDAGDKITPLIGAKMGRAMVTAHNRTVDYMGSKLETAIEYARQLEKKLSEERPRP